MPTGHYPRTKERRPGGSNALKSQLLALGAERMYRDLMKQLDALRRAYPALSRLESIPENGHQAVPAAALQMFREHKQTRSPAQTRALERARLKALKNKKARTRPAKPPTPGSLTAQMADMLRKRGAMTAKALASALYEAGDWKSTSPTEAKRAATIRVMLKDGLGKHFLRAGAPSDRPQQYQAKN